MPQIYDNIETHLVDGLNGTLMLSQRTDLCVGYFNLRGWKEITTTIENLSGAEVEERGESIHRTCRLLVGMQKLPVDILRASFATNDDQLMDNNEALKMKKQLAQEFRNQLTLGIPTKADENALRDLSRQMKQGKVIIKLHLRYPLHAKLYLAYSTDPRVPVVGFLGSSNLTLAGLAKQGELNIDVLDQDAAKKLAAWFDDRWNDRWCLDITKELVQIIDESWASERIIPPYHIYLKIAYHLSQEARAGMSEFKLPKVFRKELLEFQQKAVLVAAHHLNKRGGVIIGDVVGLGKTITATALAKIFEDDFFLETLIICPKNLVTMWEEFAHNYQLRAKVISQSKVQSELPELRRYRLVIIDESHNLRNNEGSRYRAIKAYLEENESKVILLSATPYNKSYTDLSNQLRLFLPEDKDVGISPESYIKSIGGQVQFSSRHTETFIRGIKAFEHSDFSEDWQELMRLYLVRRTRSFIKAHYAEANPDDGRKYITFADGTQSYFPERIPKRVEYEFNPKNKRDQYARLYSERIVEIINSLKLPRYGLGSFLVEKPAKLPNDSEARVMANLSRAGERLMGFCRTNLFKRLESSGYSFLLSLSRHVLKNYVYIYALQNRLPIPIGKNVSQNLDDYLDDDDIENDEQDSSSQNTWSFMTDSESYLRNAEQVYSFFQEHRQKFDWIGSEFFTPNLLTNLINDADKILSILEENSVWNADEDRQLKALHDLITQKHGKEKVLVFTQFADTARYLFSELQRRNVVALDCVTGDDESPTDKAHRFSPRSNKKTTLQNTDQELRVLVSTDVLSEGQNLQDAHIVVNYDLPWAIIRLIQRAGRVDRIGQQSPTILCYSFLPEEGLERIIQLRGRLSFRIQQNAEVVGADETFFEGDPVNLQDLYNEKSGILDGDDDETEVDLASYAYQIWKNAIDQDPALQTLIPDLPNVLYSSKHLTEQYGAKQQTSELVRRDGVIVYAKTNDDNDVLTWLSAKGNVITQSQYAILKAAECTADTPPTMPHEHHHDLVAQAMQQIREEEKNTGGGLGRRTGAKYRAYTRLDSYCKKNPLFVTETLKKAVDDIYKYPITEFARETISRQMKAGISDDQLAQLVVSLREDDKLCIIHDSEQNRAEPHIICSLSLTNS